jgi:hypothetical protein
VLKRKMRLLPTCKLSAELQAKASDPGRHETFVRHIPNPGYLPNSTKNVPKAAPTVNAVGVTLNPPYEIGDPRKLQLVQQQLGAAGAAIGGGLDAGALSSNAYLYGAGGVSGTAALTDSHGFAASDPSADGSAAALQDASGQDGGGGGGGGGTSLSGLGVVPPKIYMKPSSSNLSKHRFKKFDYGALNVRDAYLRFRNTLFGKISLYF